MGIPVLVMGASGSGKSTSLRNFTADEVSVFNVACKPLPFKGKLPMKNGAGYVDIEKALANPTKNAYVVDDSQYLSVFDNMARAKETGYGKFVDMAINEYNLVQTVIRGTPPDVIVYFLRHIDIDETGHIKAKTIGKMLDQNLGGLEGMFSVVLLCGTDGNTHWFETQSDGYTSCKTPLGMFADKRIDNDLKMVDSVIREYWELSPLVSKKKAEKKDG